MQSIIILGFNTVVAIPCMTVHESAARPHPCGGTPASSDGDRGTSRIYELVFAYALIKSYISMEGIEGGKNNTTRSIHSI